MAVQKGQRPITQGLNGKTFQVQLNKEADRTLSQSSLSSICLAKIFFFRNPWRQIKLWKYVGRIPTGNGYVCAIIFDQLYNRPQQSDQRLIVWLVCFP